MFQNSEIKDGNLRGFIQHGVVFEGTSGKQVYGSAPFADKFYVNRENKLWDSKVKGISGNFSMFLKYAHQFYKEQMTENDFKKIAQNRGLPVEAIKIGDLGKNKFNYILPIKDEKNNYCNLKFFRPGGKLMGTAGCGTQIWGLEKLAKHNDNDFIYICEGEWDGIALEWLLRKLNKKGTVLAIPGAGSFQKEWVYYFKGRHCIVLMDNDQAGRIGEIKIVSELNGNIASLKFIHWAKKFPDKFDIRDFIVMEAVKNNRPNRCLSQIHNMLKDQPRKKSISIRTIENKSNSELVIDKSMNWDKLLEKIKKWMKIDDFNPLKISVSVLLSNFIEGDPVWMFLVACPGVGKSETLGMFKNCPDVYTTSSITPNALISGAVPYKGQEPSLLPKLSGKMLCIKDFSTIQTMRDNDRDSLLGILRDAYDGSAGKDFGTGAHKQFESKFSILAGVTPSIYQLEHQFSSLGERFLKIFIGEYLDHKNQFAVIEQAMENVGKEDRMREEFSNSMYSFIENTKEYMEKEDYNPPKIGKETEKRIVNLAMWCSRMKGTVNRDKYERDVITNKAYSEIGTRTGKQLKRLMLCFPTVIYRGKEDENDYELIKQVAVDSVSAKREDIFRSVFVGCETEDDTVDIKQIIQTTKYDYSTALRSVDDLVALRILERVGHKKPYQYRVTKKMNECTKASELYNNSYSRTRPYKLSYEK